METLIPSWPVRSNIRSFVTLAGNMDDSCYGEGNLALHVGDSAGDVEQNRLALAKQMEWSRKPVWLTQVHGRRVIHLNASGVACGADAASLEADAVYTRSPGVPCIVLTADCLPILIASESTQEVAAVHAGWRGLAAGVIESTVAMFEAPTEQLMFWLGPAIGPNHFEVGGEVRQAFVDKNELLACAFASKPVSGNIAQGKADKWWMDIFSVAQIIGRRCGVSKFYGGGQCTYSDQRFYSYRRDQVTGRFATGIWFN